jgi:glyoxylate reductase
LAQETGLTAVVTGRIPEQGLRLIDGAGFRLKAYEGPEPIPRARLLDSVQGAAGILSLLTAKIDEDVMVAAGPSLKVISACAVGTDFIDLEAARRRGIVVTHTPGILAQAVVEHALALLLALTCRVIEGDKIVRSGAFRGWDAMLLLGTDLEGKTLGVIGAGEIGGRFARACRVALGMKVLYWSRSRKPALEKECGAVFRELDDLLRESDVVAPFVPLTPLTHHLLSRDCLSMMKPDSFVLNMSRGPVIDEAALVEMLKSRRIAGAALDVFENEPHVSPGLTELENVVLAPHAGSAGSRTRTRMAVLAAENLIAVLRGKPPQHRVV